MSKRPCCSNCMLCGFNHLSRYRHAADKLQKTENVMEKYKKKLEESADLRRTVKVRIPI